MERLVQLGTHITCHRSSPGHQSLASGAAQPSPTAGASLPSWAHGLTPNLAQLLTAPAALQAKSLPEITVEEARANLGKTVIDAMWGAYPHTAKRDVLIQVYHGGKVNMRLYTPLMAEEKALLERLRSEAVLDSELPAVLDLDEIVAMIDRLYAFTPTAFSTGELQNKPGENERSLKVLCWATLAGLSTKEALALFGRLYTELDPDGNGHQNIRQLAVHGISSFSVSPWPLRVRKHLPVFYHVHGGGWVVGNGIGTWDAQNQTICDTLGCMVAHIDFRSAPEYMFPVAVEDCYDGLLWLAAQAEALGVDKSRLAVGGWSAGGNLAAVMALLARDRGGPNLVMQLLGIPVTDDDFDSASYLANAEHYGLTRRTMQYFFDAYCGTGTEGAKNRASPLACPLKAESLEGLPPALVQTMEFDVSSHVALRLFDPCRPLFECLIACIKISKFCCFLV